MATSEDNLSVIIVDDEKKACANLKNMLLSYVDPAMNIAGMANSTADAEAMIATVRPHAVFLDIEMPNENAFQFLQRVSPVNFDVIFVTAYDEYALRAFKLNAVDYILKPISIEELRTAVQKLRERIAYKRLVGSHGLSYAELANQVGNKQKPQKIVLRDTNALEVVAFSDILFIEAQSSYSRIVFLKGGAVKEVVMSRPLADYEEMLPVEKFFRIHRAYLINCAHVENIITGETNSVLLLKQRQPLPISRRKYLPLIEHLQKGNYFSGQV